MSETQVVADIVPTEPTAVPEVKLQVFQQAVPFQFYAEAPGEVVEAAKDKLWEEREPTIPPHVVEKARKGFRATTPVRELRKRIVAMMGGPDAFYEPALLSIINEAFKKLTPPPKVEIFTWMSVDGREQPDGSYILNAIGYFEPEVIWTTPNKPKNFKVSYPEESETLVDDLVKGQLQGLAARAKMTEVNDDLAITLGFQTLAQLEGTVRKQVEDKHIKDKEERTIDAIREFLYSQIRISPIPETWRQYKAQEAYQVSVSRFKNEADFLKAVGYKTKEEVIRYYSAQMASSLAEQLAFRSWGIGVVEGDTSLHGMLNYFNTVRKYILKNMIVSDAASTDGRVTVEGTDESQS